VKPRIIAEKYMEDSQTKDLRDYKFFAFNGEAKVLFVATERQAKSETKFDFFDMDYNHLPFTNGHPNADVLPEKPVAFDEMRTLAEKLSVGIPQVRVDFYYVNGKVYFGEMTFFHWSGSVPFEPEEWDYKMGEMIDLDKIKG
ncbi:MAG: glycosyl transferase, partial [Ruminococcaceae bacterium]|nr:glycosyl transferase [Oscillospiraceae bacterium]